ncbi:MAG: HEAT repeat domain-containing protein [Euryarchaeota archaeon]|nr:HEAT repeat domain-containing protein [Euryarchaeota archaeon]
MPKGFYDFPKEERAKIVEKMEKSIEKDVENDETENILKYASDSDFYIRKNTYLILGRLYHRHKDLRENILDISKLLFENENEKVRQTAVYTFAEIGKKDAEEVMNFFEMALNDENHVVRNAVMGALKQMGEKNPTPILKFAQKFLHREDPEIRRIIVHGIELRGRTHPEDILPLLAELQDEENRKVRKMLIHVLGQISYKKGCLERVITELKNWNNRELVQDALIEILDVHKRYKFAEKSYEESKIYIEREFKNLDL